MLWFPTSFHWNGACENHLQVQSHATTGITVWTTVLTRDLLGPVTNNYFVGTREFHSSEKTEETVLGQNVPTLEKELYGYDMQFIKEVDSSWHTMLNILSTNFEFLPSALVIMWKSNPK